MAMTMKVAMHERHMVRKYLDKPIPADIVETLNDRIRKLNNVHGGSVAHSIVVFNRRFHLMIR